MEEDSTGASTYSVFPCFPTKKMGVMPFSLISASSLVLN